MVTEISLICFCFIFSFHQQNTGTAPTSRSHPVSFWVPENRKRWGKGWIFRIVMYDLKKPVLYRDVGKRRWLARVRVLLSFGGGWYDYTYVLPRTSPSSNLGRSSTAFICRPCTDGTPSDPAPVPAPAPEAETPAPVGDEPINPQTFAPFFDSSTITRPLTSQWSKRPRLTPIISQTRPRLLPTTRR